MKSHEIERLAETTRPGRRRGVKILNPHEDPNERATGVRLRHAPTGQIMTATAVYGPESEFPGSVRVLERNELLLAEEFAQLAADEQAAAAETYA